MTFKLFMILFLLMQPGASYAKGLGAAQAFRALWLLQIVVMKWELTANVLALLLLDSIGGENQYLWGVSPYLCEIFLHHCAVRQQNFYHPTERGRELLQ